MDKTVTETTFSSESSFRRDFLMLNHGLQKKNTKVPTFGLDESKKKKIKGPNGLVCTENTKVPTFGLDES